MSGISENHDLIVFEAVIKEFPHYPHGLGSIYRGQMYKQLGVSPDRQPTWKDGIVSEKHGMSNFLILLILND